MPNEQGSALSIAEEQLSINALAAGPGNIANQTGVTSPCGFIPDVEGNLAYFNSVCTVGTVIGAAVGVLIGTPFSQSIGTTPTNVAWPASPAGVNVQTWSNGGSFVPSQGLTVTRRGLYWINADIRFAPGGTAPWTINNTVNGTPGPQPFTEPDPVVITWQFLLVLNPGDIVSFQLSISAGTTTLTSITVSAILIGTVP